MPRVFSEVLGRYVEIPERPERIVSLAPSITETLFLIGAGDRVAGVSFFCNKPPEARRKPRVGSYWKVNYGRLEELKPDLVLVTTGAQRKTMMELAERGYTVYPVPLPTSLYGILENIVVVGHVAAATREARRLARRVASRLEMIRGLLEGRRVYYEIWLGGPVTAGRFSYISDAISHLGAENCFDTHPEPWVINPDPREARECRPDLVVVELPPYSPGLARQVARSLEERGITGLPAVRERGLLVLEPDSLAHYGPSIAEALEDLALAARGKRPPHGTARWAAPEALWG